MWYFVVWFVCVVEILIVGKVVWFVNWFLVMVCFGWGFVLNGVCEWGLWMGGCYVESLLDCIGFGWWFGCLWGLLGG